MIQLEKVLLSDNAQQLSHLQLSNKTEDKNKFFMVLRKLKWHRWQNQYFADDSNMTRALQRWEELKRVFSFAKIFSLSKLWVSLFSDMAKRCMDLTCNIRSFLLRAFSSWINRASSFGLARTRCSFMQFIWVVKIIETYLSGPQGVLFKN